MATNHTTHYDLNQWQATDQVLRTDFNADNAKLEAALADKAEAEALTQAVGRITSLESGKAGQTEVNALESTVQQLTADFTKITFGSYKGNGTQTRTIALGVQPKAVLVLAEWGATVYSANYFQYLGGLALQEKPAQTRQGDDYITIVSNGFQVSMEGTQDKENVLINSNLYTFYYIAFS